MDIQSWATNLVDDVHREWKLHRDHDVLFGAGYRVFYSPVRMNPPLMIIGYNPGGGSESFDEREARNIPIFHDYFIDDYHLARRMRDLFYKIGKSSLLSDSVKLNLIYFRSKDVNQWNKLTASTRKNIEKFCISKTKEIIETLSPKIILAEGITTYSRLKKALDLDCKEEITESNGRVIFIESKNHKFKFYGVIHPSGARINQEEWGIIAKQLSVKL